jgi:tetratricopeptide (TPR) repeat protein
MSTENSDTPILSNLTQEHSPHFTGREALLSELRQRMTGGHRVQAIHGLGGIGKSRLAIEYGHRYRGHYAVIWWVRADEPALIAASLFRLVTSLGRPLAEGAPPELIRDALRGVLARRESLLIFDGASDPKVIRPFLGPEGHVLITSRNPSWGELGQSQPLRVLDRADAITFLRNRTGRKETDSSAEKLAHALGDLPLALEQAAACIEQEGLSFGDYLSRFETEWAQLLQAGRRPVDYPHTVAMTWGLSFSAVEADSPPATDLMNLCAFLCPDRVSRKVLGEGREHLPARLMQLVSEPRRLDEAVAQLRKYSLVEADGQGVSLHRLVAVITRDRLDDEQQMVWCNAAVRFLAGSFSFDSSDVRSWQKCEEWLPHVLEATAHAERLNTSPDESAQLLNDAGRYLLKRAQFTEAKAALERAQRICRHRYGDEHPRMSAIVNNLGRVQQELGDASAAMESFQQAMSIDAAAYGAEHPHVAEVGNNYGISLQRQGESELARQQFQRAAEVYEARNGPYAPKLAHILNNLGYALKSTGDIEGARVQFLRALTIAENTVGEDHPTTARVLYNIASLHRAAGHFSLALEHLERSLAIDTAALGPNHPEAAKDCTALADVLTLMGDPQAAAGYRERAERIAAEMRAKEATVV